MNILSYFKKFFLNSPRRNKTRISHLYDRSDLDSISLSEYKLLVLLLLNDSHKRPEDISLGVVQNQSIVLTYDSVSDVFSNRNSFYKARDSLIERGLLAKSDKRGVYYINPIVINRCNKLQNIYMGLLNEKHLK